LHWIGLDWMGWNESVKGNEGIMYTY